jgi:hypothetical protein
MSLSHKSSPKKFLSNNINSSAFNDCTEHKKQFTRQRNKRIRDRKNDVNSPVKIYKILKKDERYEFKTKMGEIIYNELKQKKMYKENGLYHVKDAYNYTKLLLMTTYGINKDIFGKENHEYYFRKYPEEPTKYITNFTYNDIVYILESFKKAIVNRLFVASLDLLFVFANICKNNVIAANICDDMKYIVIEMTNNSSIINDLNVLMNKIKLQHVKNNNIVTKQLIFDNQYFIFNI